MIRDAKTNVEKFWNKVDKTPGLGPQGTCWEWQGRLDKVGYGITAFGRDNKVPGRKGAQRAHRISYELLIDKDLPTSSILMHKCDNRKCVNPAHLSPGTQGENVYDMVEKRRHIKGEQVHNAVLKVSDVESIRLHSLAGYDLIAISDILGTSRSTVRSALQKANWKSVEVSKDDPRVEALRPAAKEYMEKAKRGGSSISALEVKEIKNLISAGRTNVYISKQFGCGTSTVSRIRHGITWKEV